MSALPEMNQNRRPILMDTDTASDDAVALIMALRSPSVEVKAITTVAGNVPVEQAILRLAEQFEGPQPVAASDSQISIGNRRTSFAQRRHHDSFSATRDQ
jgi:inosine-uridine nucleoside N-ribohydrolase